MSQESRLYTGTGKQGWADNNRKMQNMMRKRDKGTSSMRSQTN